MLHPEAVVRVPQEWDEAPVGCQESGGSAPVQRKPSERRWRVVWGPLEIQMVRPGVCGPSRPGAGVDESVCTVASVTVRERHRLRRPEHRMAPPWSESRREDRRTRLAESRTLVVRVAPAPAGVRSRRAGSPQGTPVAARVVPAPAGVGSRRAASPQGTPVWSPQMLPHLRGWVWLHGRGAAGSRGLDQSRPAVGQSQGR